MEVASPLTSLGPPKRVHQCGSPVADDERRKRRRFLAPSEMDALSEDFSSQSIFYKTPAAASVFTTNGASSFLKRVRMAAAAEVPPPDPAPHDELERLVQEQARQLESLQADKATLEKTVAAQQSDIERLTRDNGILRKAVTIQEERRVAAEHEAQQFRAQTQERVQGLEQVIRTLRYHLQAATAVGNDFMQPRPPDVY